MFNKGNILSTFRCFLLLVLQLVSMAGFSTGCLAASTDAAQYVESTLDGVGGNVAWYLYRNTLVATAENGNPMCIGSNGCLQMASTDLATLQSVVTNGATPENELVCNSIAYIQAWGPVPSDARHWCNAYKTEALTVRADAVSSKPVFTVNYAAVANLGDPSVAFVVAPGMGPTGTIRSAQSGVYTIITVLAINQVDQMPQNIILRASRLTNCGYETYMNNQIFCDTMPESQLKLEFVPADNPNLPFAEFAGAFQVGTVYGSGGVVYFTAYVDINNIPRFITPAVGVKG